jgi:FG-GAP repeat
MPCIFFKLCIATFIALIVSGCSEFRNPSDTPNTPPTASSVNIIDSNSGDAIIGDSLIGGYTYGDVNGDAEGASTFRWLRDGSPISGATEITYTVVAADIGTLITFEVTPIASTGIAVGEASTSTSIAIINSAPTASSLSITDSNGGNAIVGDSLTGNYTYADAEGDSESTSTLRWLRNGSPISGATTATYTLVAADSGATITFEVTPLANTGTTNGATNTSSSIAVVNSAPSASSATITDGNGGDAVVGDTLTGSYTYTDIDDDTEGSSLFRWLRGGSAIGGATASTYILVAADSGTSITFEVTPIASAGVPSGAIVTSSSITVVNSAPTASSVSISDGNGGNAVVGDSLTGNYTYADVDGDSEGTSTFRWLRNGSAIGGATASTYTLVAADSGTAITFEVTPVASSGMANGALTASSGVAVINSAPSANSLSISDGNGGNAAVGDNLTGNYTYADLDGDSEGTSIYRWLRDGSPISGATATTYTPVAADIAATITFEVTPIASTGNTNGATMTSSGINISSENTASVNSTIPKTFSFSWFDVGASYYKLQKNPDGISGFSQLGSNIAGTSVNEVISVHTYDWSGAQYLIESCDALDSCQSSNTLTTASLELDAIGYIKASNSAADLKFGSTVASSSDGSVVATTGGLSVANDIYIYRYDPGSGWSEEIIADIPSGFIKSLSISGDGNVIAVGNTQNNVYVYKFTTAWALEFTIPTPGGSATFGSSVALSRDGQSLAIGDPTFSTNGSAYVFIDDLDGTWSQRGTLMTAPDATVNLGAGIGVAADAFGQSVALSSDGTLLVVAAVYAETATAIDAGHAYVYSWGGLSWALDDTLSAQTPVRDSLFGQSLSLSDDGATLAVGLDPLALDGEVHIFRDSGGWALQGSPLEPVDGNGEGFGRSVTLSADGNTLLVGAYNENTLGSGINPTPDTGAASSGAAFLFTYGGASWSQTTFIKSPNPVASDQFGYAVDMSADASTLVIGAFGEDSNSTGINSTYNNDGSANTSGAIYLY